MLGAHSASYVPCGRRHRPAVATGDDRVEAALGAASAHRVLRGSVAATLTVTGGLPGVSGSAVQRVASSTGHEALALLGATAGACGRAAPAETRRHALAADLAVGVRASGVDDEGILRIVRAALRHGG